jgi:hypothetical protein
MPCLIKLDQTFSSDRDKAVVRELSEKRETWRSYAREIL